MHKSALKNGQLFLQLYCEAPNLRVLDVGAYDVNGSLRAFKPATMDFVGADLSAGPGVDVVIETPDCLPFADAEFDAVVSTSTYEHAAHFWLLLLETVRVAKPGGHIYINAPSNGAFHQYPFDYWRFYPDAGLAFVDWIRKNGHPASLIESGIAAQGAEQWSDFVAVLQKSDWPVRDGAFLTSEGAFRNVRRCDREGVLDKVAETEDQTECRRLRGELAEWQARAGGLEQRLAEVEIQLAEAARKGSPIRRALAGFGVKSFRRHGGAHT